MFSRKKRADVRHIFIYWLAIFRKRWTYQAIAKEINWIQNNCATAMSYLFQFRYNWFGSCNELASIDISDIDMKTTFEE